MTFTIKYLTGETRKRLFIAFTTHQKQESRIWQVGGMNSSKLFRRVKKGPCEFHSTWGVGKELERPPSHNCYQKKLAWSRLNLKDPAKILPTQAVKNKRRAESYLQINYKFSQNSWTNSHKDWHMKHNKQKRRSMRMTSYWTSVEVVSQHLPTESLYRRDLTSISLPLRCYFVPARHHLNLCVPFHRNI